MLRFWKDCYLCWWLDFDRISISARCRFFFNDCWKWRLVTFYGIKLNFYFIKISFEILMKFHFYKIPFQIFLTFSVKKIEIKIFTPFFNGITENWLFSPFPLGEMEEFFCFHPCDCYSQRKAHISLLVLKLFPCFLVH